MLNGNQDYAAGSLQVDAIGGNAATNRVADILLATNGDPDALRPIYDPDSGKSYIRLVNNGKAEYMLLSDGRTPITNAPATLRRDDWISFDRELLQVSRERLQFYKALRAAGLVHTVDGGMGASVLHSETMTDVNGADVSMDGMRRAEADRPEFASLYFPLPIIHFDYYFSLRAILAARRGRTKLDTTMANEAGHKVAEEIEKLALGVSSYNGKTFGGASPLYGLTTYPDRLTKSLADPTGASWIPKHTFKDVLSMKQALNNIHIRGDFMLIASPAWDEYLDDDYSAAKGDLSLRQRISQINGIDMPITVDHLTGYQLILLHKSTKTVRAVVGMEMKNLQWETHGGMEYQFKAMTIQHTQFRSDANGVTGINHGSVS